MWLIYGLFKVTLMGASFDQFQTCSSCVAAGHGWSSAKHRCGGFKTRRCEPQEEAQPGNGAKDELQVQDPGCVDLPVLCKGRAPLVIVRRGALSEQQLSGLETLTAKVERNGPQKFVRQSRSFAGVTGNQEVTFLHEEASEEQLALLWSAVRSAAQQVPSTGWKPSLRRPTLRCLEAISYFSPRELPGSASRAWDAPLDDPQEIGWHHDGATRFTMAIALTDAGQHFTGGEFDIRSARSWDWCEIVSHHSRCIDTVSDAKRGDVVVWRGWDAHRVRAVHSGVRRVIVAEWWEGDGADSNVERPVDSFALLQENLKLDPDSGLNMVLASHVADPDPAEDPNVNVRNATHRAFAERCALRAISLDKNDEPEARRVLGVCHHEAGRLQEAKASFLHALKLEPGHADALIGLARLYIEMGRYKRAERLLGRVDTFDVPSLLRNWVAAQDMLTRARADRAGR